MIYIYYFVHVHFFFFKFNLIYLSILILFFFTFSSCFLQLPLVNLILQVIFLFSNRYDWVANWDWGGYHKVFRCIYVLFFFYGARGKRRRRGRNETKRNEREKKLRRKFGHKKKNNNNTIKNFTVSTMWRKWIVWCGRIILGFLKIPTFTLNQLKRELNDVWKLNSLSFLLSRIKQVLIVLFFFQF